MHLLYSTTYTCTNIGQSTRHDSIHDCYTHTMQSSYTIEHHDMVLTKQEESFTTSMYLYQAKGNNMHHHIVNTSNVVTHGNHTIKHAFNV